MLQDGEYTDAYVGVTDVEDGTDFRYLDGSPVGGEQRWAQGKTKRRKNSLTVILGQILEIFRKCCMVFNLKVKMTR